MKKISLLSLIAALMIFTNCGKDDSVTINPVDLNFADSDLTVDESAGTQTITISLGDVAPIEGTFTITLGGTATYGDDYTTTPAAEDGVVTVTVSEGDESKELTVTIVDDSDLELDETITMTIASDIEALELGSDASATVTLTSNDQALVAVERSSGKMYMVNLEDGSKTDLLTVTGIESEVIDGIKAQNAEENSANIRSFIYHAGTEKGFIGQNYNGGSKIYTVNMSTGAATEVFANNEEDFYMEGILDFHLDGNTLYGASYHNDNTLRISETTSGHSFYKINKSSGAISNITTLRPGRYVGGGALLVDEDMVYFSDRWYFIEEEGEEGSEVSALVSIDLTDEESEQGTAWSTDDEADFLDDSETFDIQEVAVQTFAVSDNGDIYAVVSTANEGSPGVWYLASVDLANAKLGYVALLANGNATQASAIGFLPEEVVVPLLSE